MDCIVHGVVKELDMTLSPTRYKVQIKLIEIIKFYPTLFVCCYS